MIDRTNKNWREIYSLREIIKSLKWILQSYTELSEEEQDRIQEQIMDYENRIRELRGY